MYSKYFSVKGLEELLHAPRVVSGGGCAETVLANYITQWVGVYVTPMYFINKIILYCSTTEGQKVGFYSQTN